MTATELKTMNAHPWKHRDYCPANLRDLRKVLADAEPAVVRDYQWSAPDNKNMPTGQIDYMWWCAGGDWWGVLPPAGIVPHELAVQVEKDCGTRRFRTATEARQALQRAAAKLDPRIPATA